MQYFGFDRPSFGIKTFGFGESSPKLQANFTTGTYKAGGESKTFADLFTFTRAGKAWLVKDTGLQEYAADAPRFDNGLLIEQSATNTHFPSYNMDYGSSTGLIMSNLLAPDGINYNQTVQEYGVATNRYQYSVPTTLYNKDFVVSWFALSSGNIYKLVNTVNTESVFYATTTNVLSVGVINSKNTERHYCNLKTIANPSATPLLRFYMIDKSVEGTGFWGWQVEQANKPTSYIPTTTSPITRPADFLASKITGITVTGDWDSTLTLSIVAGKLVHSGYGRIRSLEIN